jgi:hypothetical protein
LDALVVGLARPWPNNLRNMTRGTRSAARRWAPTRRRRETTERDDAHEEITRRSR